MPEPLAIIGMACTVPGAENYDDYWRLLTASSDSTERGSASFEDAHLAQHIHHMELFDRGRYGLTEQESLVMDPQCRQFLMLVDTTFSDAGYPRGENLGTVGVVASQASNGTYHDYLATLIARDRIAPLPALLEAVNRGSDFLATRASYTFDLQGPSFNLQCGCSSSLVAIGEACHLLWAGRCEAVLAGGVTITYPPEGAYKYEPGSIFSRNGQCRPFDAEADGTVPANGGGVVLLKRLCEALKDGDRIHAIVRGAGLNNDGARKVSFAAPASEGQYELLRETYAAAGVVPAQLAFVECHATATLVGDPIEVRALKRFVESNSSPATSDAILLGSVKGHIGHLFWSSGVISMIKSVLALKYGMYPGTSGLVNPNPLLELAGSPFRIPSKATLLDLHDRSCCGVSSFGVGGTNAHIILERHWGVDAKRLKPEVPELRLQHYSLLPGRVGDKAQHWFRRTPEFEEKLQPATALCEEIVSLYEEVLGEQSVSSDSNYFDLNGDSITAVALIVRLEEIYRVTLTQTDIYDCPTPLRLTARINARVGSIPLAVCPHPRLNPFQARFYLLEKLQRGSFSHYNVPLCLTADVEPDWSGFCTALTDVLQDIPEFAATLRWSPDGITLGQPRELVTETQVLTLTASDDAERYFNEFFGRRFNLENGPSARAVYVRQSGQHHIAINFPHLLIDGTGLENLLRRVESRMKGDHASLPPLSEDVSNWHSTDAAYWREHLRDVHPTTLARTRDKESCSISTPIPNSASERCLILPNELMFAAKDICRERNLTPFVLFYTIFNIVLARKSGKRKVVTGTTLNNRSARTLRRVDCRMTNIPIGVEIDEGIGFSKILTMCNERLAESFLHANAPLDVIIQAAGISGAPYRILFMFQNQNTGYQIEINKNMWREGPYRYRPLYAELCVYFQTDVNDRVTLMVHYHPERYEASEMRSLIDEFISLAYEFTSKVRA